VIVEGDCTTVAGSGNPGAPYIVNLEIDPAANNQAACGDDGLLVEPPLAGDCIAVDDAAVPATISVEVDPLVDNRLVCNVDGLYVPPSEIVVADTDCIDLEGVGTVGDPVTATPIISPDVANLLECVASPDPDQGLRARLAVSNLDDCVNLGGDGSVAAPLSPVLNLSADPGNTVECRGDGLFVPAVAQAAVDMRATVLHNGFLSSILPPAALGATSSIPIDYDVDEEVVGLITHLGGGPAYANTYIEVPAGGAGVYLVQATHPAWSGLPIYAGDLIMRLRLYRGTTAGGPSDGIGQSAQGNYKQANAAFNAPYLHVSRTITLAVGDVIACDFAVEDYNGAFAGATLDVGPTYGAGAPGPPNAGRPFLQMTRIGLP
jgi:hypothetical protein